MPECSIILLGQSAGFVEQAIAALEASHRRHADVELFIGGDGAPRRREDVSPGLVAHTFALDAETPAESTAARNQAAALASGKYLLIHSRPALFTPGWLDCLLRFAEEHPGAAVVASKLIGLSDKVRHAGIVCGRDHELRYLYAGFPADHPAANVSRRFQMVDLEDALIRRDAFEEANGFETTLGGIYADADLCLRLGERRHEIYYCHQSVVQKLTAGPAPLPDRQQPEFFRARWFKKTHRDEFDYYLDDGLVQVRSGNEYPIELSLSPAMTIAAEKGTGIPERLTAVPARDLVELIKTSLRHYIGAADNSSRITRRLDTLSGSMATLLAGFENVRGLSEEQLTLAKEFNKLQEFASERLMVSQCTSDTDRLVCCIEEPAPGRRLENAEVPLAGWVFGRSSPVVAVELVRPGAGRRRVPLTVARPDIAAEYPEAGAIPCSGFAAAIPLLDLFRGTHVDLQARHEDGSSTFMATIAVAVGSPNGDEALPASEPRQENRAETPATNPGPEPEERTRRLHELAGEVNRLSGELSDLRTALGDGLRVHRHESGDALVEFALDAPSAEAAPTSSELPVSGWVVSRGHPVTGVELVTPGDHRRRVPLSLARPDIAALYPGVAGAENSGFHVAISVLDLLREGEVRLEAMHDDGHSTLLATIELRFGARTEPPPEAEQVADTLGDGDLAVLGRVMSRGLVVTRCQDGDGRLADFYLDAPLSGSRLTSHLVPVAGWVLGRDGPVAAVELVSADGERCRLPLSERPDIAAAFPEIPEALFSGFNTTLELLHLVREMPMLVEAVHEDGNSTTMWQIGVGGESSNDFVPDHAVPLSGAKGVQE
jgi:hypothetical protein